MFIVLITKSYDKSVWCNFSVHCQKYKVLSTLYAEVNPIKGLTIKSQFAADY